MRVIKGLDGVIADTLSLSMATKGATQPGRQPRCVAMRALTCRRGCRRSVVVTIAVVVVVVVAVAVVSVVCEVFLISYEVVSLRVRVRLRVSSLSRCSLLPSNNPTPHHNAR